MDKILNVRPEPKFKIGDEVRIKDNLIAGELIDGITVAKGMVIFCNVETKIIGNSYSPIMSPGYLLDIDGGTYTWTDSMLDFVTKSDDVGVASNQEHYKKASMQPIQFMQTLMTYEQFEGFLLGQIIKYRCRKNFKGQTQSDINKANQYLYWLKLHREGHIIDPIKDSVPSSFTYNGI